MYKRLRTKNFKLHADAEFFFTQGLNLIIGPNYRGKSTLLRAIAFALFGTSVLPGKKENIQTRGSNGKVSVELDFVSPVDGETYMVERTLNDATLSHADGLVATGITNVNRKIEQLLGMSAKRWAQLGYARQKFTDHIVTSMGSTEVNKIIEELGGIDLVNSVLLLLKDENSHVEGALMAVPEVDLLALETRLAAAQAAEKTALSTQEQALLREKSATQVLEESQISRTNAENLNSKRQILLAAHERAQRAVASAEEESKKLCERIQNKPCGEGDIELREQQVQALREKAAALIALNNEKNALSREVHSLYNQIQKWREAYEKNEAELNELQSCAVVDITNCEQEIKDRTERRAVMRAELAEKTSALANSTCHACKRPYTATEKELEALKLRCNELKVQIAAEDEQIKALVIDKETAERTNNRIAKLADDNDGIRHLYSEAMQQYEAKNTRLAEVVAELADAPADLSSQIEAITREVSEMRKALAQYNADLAAQTQADMRLKTAREELSSLEPVPDAIDMEPLVEAVAAASAEVADAKERREAADRAVWAAQSDIKQCNQLLQDGRESAKKRSELVAQHARIGKLTKYLRNNRDRFMSEMWNGVMAYASHFVSNCTSGHVSRVLRDDGSFLYEEGGSIVPVDEASGAQQSIMGVAVQMGLSKLLPCALGGILLDEPTSDMDPVHSAALASLLAAEHGQVIMVTHRDMDLTFAKNVIDLGV